MSFKHKLSLTSIDQLNIMDKNKGECVARRMKKNIYCFQYLTLFSNIQPNFGNITH